MQWVGQGESGTVGTSPTLVPPSSLTVPEPPSQGCLFALQLLMVWVWGGRWGWRLPCGVGRGLRTVTRTSLGDTKGCWGWRGLQAPPRPSRPRRHQLALLHDRAEMQPAATPLVSAVPPGPGDTEPGSLPPHSSEQGSSLASPRGFLVSQPGHPLPTSTSVSRGVPRGVPGAATACPPQTSWLTRRG